MTSTPFVSFIIPVKDEEQSLAELVREILAQRGVLAGGLEIVFVDDGSRDGTWPRIRELARAHPDLVSAIRFRCNLGKADALAAGFAAAQGDVIFTMDGDLQDNPEEIGRFLAKLDEGFDIVTGWKRLRHDPWHKVLPSRVFNAALSAVAGIKLHDHNCGFKCYRREVVKDLPLYGGMHRMIPSLGWFKGYRCAEIEVAHRPRVHGQSKYGIRRFLKGFLDLLTVVAIRKFRDAPLHLMAALALLTAVGGSALLAMACFISSHVAEQIVMTLGGASLAATVPIIGMGLLAELAVFARMQGERRLPIVEEVGSGSQAFSGAIEEKIVSLPRPVGRSEIGLANTEPAEGTVEPEATSLRSIV